MRDTCEECGSENLSMEWVKRMSRDCEELEATCSDCGHSHMNDLVEDDSSKDND